MKNARNCAVWLLVYGAMALLGIQVVSAQCASVGIGDQQPGCFVLGDCSYFKVCANVTCFPPSEFCTYHSHVLECNWFGCALVSNCMPCTG
jgi:hypothetical protein